MHLHRRTREIALLVTSLVLATVCSAASPEIVLRLAPGADSHFRGLPGTIGLTIQDRQQVRRYVLRDGALRKVDELPKAPRTATANIAPYGATGILDNGADYRITGPYLVSPDERLVVASAEFRGVDSASPTGYVIADVNSKKVLVSSRSSDQAVYGVAWAPDSRLVALLRKRQARTGKSPTEVLSALAGHPIQYMIYSVQVVDTAGKVVAESTITSELAGTWGEITWQ